jgi:hypothetical protein
MPAARDAHRHGNGVPDDWLSDAEIGKQRGI